MKLPGTSNVCRYVLLSVVFLLASLACLSSSAAAVASPEAEMTVSQTRVTFKHSPIKVPDFDYYCDRTDEHAEECIEGGWRTEMSNRGGFGFTVDAHLHAGEAEAAAALKSWMADFEHDFRAKIENYEKKFKKDNPENSSESKQLKQEIIDWPVTGFDGGFVRELRKTTTRDVHRSRKSGCYSMCNYRETSVSAKLVIVLKRGNVIFEGSVDLEGPSRYDRDPADWDEHESQRARTDETAQKSVDDYRRKKVADDIPKLLPVALDLQRQAEKFLKQWNQRCNRGRDFAYMTLDELLELRMLPASPRLVKRVQDNLDHTLKAFSDAPPGLINPDLESLVAEWRSAEVHFSYSYRWVKELKTMVAALKAKDEDFSLHWQICMYFLNGHYLHNLRLKIEAGGALSASKRHRLRTGLIGGFRGYYLSCRMYPGNGRFATENTFIRVNILRLLALVPPASGSHTYGRLELLSAERRIAADGQSSIGLTVKVTRLPEKDGEGPRPVKGAVVTLENVAFKGAAPGHLSTRQVVTGADGTARAIYMAPKADEVPKGPVPRAEIRAGCAKLGLKESVYIDFDLKQPVSIKAAHLIIPADQAAPNEITFRFETPKKDWGKDFKAVIRCASDHGIISTFDKGKKGARELSIKAVSGADNTLIYRWNGPQATDKPFEEAINIEIPDLELAGRLELSVGIDLAVDEASIAWKPPFQPFLTIPIKVFVKDRLHPDADLARLFDEFEISPALSVREEGFSPVKLMASDKREDTLVAAAGRFLERHTGSSKAGTCLTRNLVIAGVKKTPDGRWLLMEKDLTGKGLTVDQAYPAVIPYKRGTYRVSVLFDPKLKGDAGAGKPLSLKPIEVSLMSARQGQVEYFLLPTLKAVAGLTEAGGLALGLTDVALKIKEGDTKGAIVDAAAMLAGKYLGDKLGGAMKTRYRKSMNRFYKERVAGALNKSADALLPRETELALRLAYPYKLADWVETVTGWALDKTMDDLRSSSGSGFDKKGLPSKLLAQLSDMIASPAWAAVPAEDPMKQSLEYLKLFMKGYGNDYGVLIVTRDGLTSLKATDSDGRLFKPAPANVFGGKDPVEMMVTGKNVVVIPFERERDIKIELAGKGRPVRIYKILDEDVTSGILDYHGSAWEKRLTVKGGRK